MAGFSAAQWTQFLTLARDHGADFGLPERRDRSVVLGTFNTLKLGKDTNSAKRWDFLQLIAERFDLLALQEVADSLDGLRRLHAALGDEYGLVVSDTTGAAPGAGGLKERLAFLFRWDRIRREELASDITYDRSYVVHNLYENRAQWFALLDGYAKAAAKAKAAGKKAPRFSDLVHPAFLTFIRTPHCAAFTIPGRGRAADVGFLAVNAHMLYGQKDHPEERQREFEALIDWLVQRAKARDNMYYRNLVLMGDLNMDFEDPANPRSVVDNRLRALNKNRLSAKQAGEVNFPLLSPHPGSPGGALFVTAARGTETYDHIAFFIDPKERGLPRVPQNAQAGQGGADGYDYGVFRFTDLFAQVLHGQPFHALSKARQTSIYNRCKADISDHMPAWVRLPVPGA